MAREQRRKPTTIGESTEPLRSLVREFLDRYPLSRPRDVYRLIRSGTCGPDAGATELDAARLEELLAGAGEAPLADESVRETVSLDGSIVRVNLRPWVAAGGELECLADIARRSAASIEPRRDQLFTLWAGFVHMHRRHEFRFDRDELDHLEMTLASAAYPEVGHSEAYVEAYRPAYVIVRAELVDDQGQ
jgi:hypothetical protein